MIYQSLIYLLFMAQAPVAPHPLKMSVCDARYQADTRQLKLKFKFFWDDLEAALEKQLGRDLTLTARSADNDRVLRSFVEAHFKLSINGQSVALRHVRSDVLDVMLIVEFSAENVEPADTYSVDLTDDILLDVYSDQYNLARFDFFGDGNLETLRFERAERRLSKNIRKH